MQNQPEQIRKPESVNVEWEEFNGKEGNKRGYLWEDGVEVETNEGRWIPIQTAFPFENGREGLFVSHYTYRRPKTPTVSPQGNVSAPESQEAPSELSKEWAELELHTTQEKLSEIELHRKLLQTQTELMREQHKNIQTDRENNALISSQKAQIAELQAQVRRLEQENAMLEVCDKDGAVSPPEPENVTQNLEPFIH